jgi:glycosidase
MEFRIARSARDQLDLAETIFATAGDVVMVDPSVAALVARRLEPDDEPAQARVATDLEGLGLIHELSHKAIGVERRRAGGGGPLRRGLEKVAARVGAPTLRSTLEAFEGAFPASPVYRGEVTPQAWLERTDAAVGAQEGSLEELLLLWLANQNPAAGPYAELLDDDPLAATSYARVVGSLRGADLPPDEPHPEREAPARSLVDRLLAPIEAAPHSLAGQLRFIREHWVGWLDEADLARLDRGLEALAAEERATWLRFRRGAPGGTGEAGGPDLATDSGEPEAFSPDRDWMPELVLLAKSTYVWLGQLGRRYGRDIHRLDQVPDEELDLIVRRGFTGLWLIGIWQRSPSSERIKRMRGNPDAVASAYSVADYRVADDLGGDAAWADLHARAFARGIRLAADMVPNHMGIDSDWVMAHPERFISRPTPPYPSYTFDGPDLSADPRAAIVLEDHYWDSSDAAVVFKRVDRASGATRYIYHGNDGTSFPWNDTAQLDYLDPAVREAVIGQILEVARRFRVIRFDAAMVLAKRHIQRLWYPPPGHEGGIPSRAASAIPRSEFERRMPREFWREVVDRVAAELPDTLLLAEAFWLMEGYFVRTLGMHRVYNSAFMHMLRDERNADYQAVMRETIAFDRRILGRYVNFMSNPDERTAVDQFGSGDKYLGVATLLATLPGLPMFGHGQVEGFHEKYGMEFRRASWDEVPDEGLVARHEQVVFPLLRQRWRFTGAEHFRLLEATDEGGAAVPDVFAYANRAASGPAGVERRSLIVYLNRFERAHVRVQGVTDALGLSSQAGRFVLLHDRRSGGTCLRSAADLAAGGLELRLDGYGCHVFLDFEEVVDGPGREWSRLAWRLGLDPVPDVHAALRRLLDEPFREAARALFPAEVIRTATDTPVAREAAPLASRPSGWLEAGRLEEALARLVAASGADVDASMIATRVARQLGAVAALVPAMHRMALTGWVLGAAMAEAGALGSVVTGDGEAGPLAADAFARWDAAEAFGAALRELGERDADAWRATQLARALLAVPMDALAPRAPSGAEGAGGEGEGRDRAVRVAQAPGGDAPGPDLPAWLDLPPVREAAGWNEWQGRRFVVRESWDQLVDVLAARDAILGRPAHAQVAADLKVAAAREGYEVRGRADATTEPPAEAP